ncbi:hypothetical protein GOB91_29225 [Sinorhizobium meliloti]|nr:hypothetical protein [Sinorhizobium meliloti]MDW9732637.1 hypothetical protein [Sinorhizobium meliloti]MDX1240385.1 hypothetical protein [Sinorhizobium medicae]
MKSTDSVETVNKMSCVLAGEYLDKMIEREAESSNRETAIATIARRYGFTKAQILHLRGGRAKDVRMSVFMKIRAAYLDHCERLMARLIHEIETEKLRFGSDHFQGLDAEAAALAEKIRKEKERIG